MTETGASENPKESVPKRFSRAFKEWLKDRMPSSVEAEWLTAHQKIVDAIEPGKTREFFLKLKDLFSLYGKVQGISSLVADASFAAAAAGFIIARPTKIDKLRRAGIPEKNLESFIKEVDERPTVRIADAQKRARLLKNRSPWALSAALSLIALGPTRQLNRFAAKMAGDHVGSIVNRIVGKTPSTASSQMS